MSTFQWYKGNVALTGETTSSYIASEAGKYYCIVTNADGCQRITQKASVTESCRMAGNDVFELNIYPNPAMHYTVIEIHGSENQQAYLLITDMTGKAYAQQNVTLQPGINAVELNTQFMPSGVYTISLIRDGEETSVQKLVIEK
jgi:hypothetical protein